MVGTRSKPLYIITQHENDRGTTTRPYGTKYRAVFSRLAFLLHWITTLCAEICIIYIKNDDTISSRRGGYSCVKVRTVCPGGIKRWYQLPWELFLKVSVLSSRCCSVANLTEVGQMRRRADHLVFTYPPSMSYYTGEMGTGGRGSLITTTLYRSFLTQKSLSIYTWAFARNRQIPS